MIKITKLSNISELFLTHLKYSLKSRLFSRVRDFTVYKTCNSLGIPIPDCAYYMKELDEQIENVDLPDKKGRKK